MQHVADACPPFGLRAAHPPTPTPALHAALASGAPSPTASKELHADAPERHPEWLLFQWSWHAFGLPFCAIEVIWQELLHGVQHQERINARLREHRLRAAGTAIPRLAVHNVHFERVARAVGPYLRVAHGQGPMALWAGRFEVGVYAQLRGYTTLEATQAGRALGRLEVYHRPQAVVPLYRYLAREFVRQNPLGEAHVFVRTHDPLGALYRRSLPVVDKDNPSRPTVWHPVGDEELRDLASLSS